LRGIGTVTVALIKNVAESWYNGEVEVTEQPSLYTVKIKFVSKLGVPSNLADIQNALREIIPAHLAINFEFSYLLIKDVHNVMTLSQLEATTLDKFAGGA
ncbi:MAG: YmfQ family protein, partial [Anoxybacillus ayderensis]|nr:YmfQ family protein [Anoxybacillus ayderensis]